MNINDSCHVNGLVKTVSNTEAAKTCLQLGDELVKDSGLDQELGSGRADLALVEPDGVHHTLDGGVQVSGVEHNDRGLAAQLQGDLLASASCGHPQYLAYLS